MTKNKKNPAVRAIFLYLLITAGIWMFLNSYSSFCRRLSGEQITPASIEVRAETAEINVLKYRADIDLSGVSADSKFWYAAYLLAADEIKADILLAETMIMYNAYS